MKIQGPATSPKFSKINGPRNIIFKEKLPMAPSFILYLGEESIVSSRSSCRGKVWQLITGWIKKSYDDVLEDPEGMVWAKGVWD